MKWVYETKLNPDETIQRQDWSLKAYSQQPIINYNEAFAQVACLDTIGVLLALTTQKGWNIYQLDVKLTFLNGVLEEEIYVESQGFINNGNKGKVLRLKKSLYGLKQAHRPWYNKIINTSSIMDLEGARVSQHYILRHKVNFISLSPCMLMILSIQETI